MSTIPLTVAGAEALRKELHEMKTVHRPAVIAAIAEARAHGDLSETPNMMLPKKNKVLLRGVLLNWKVNSPMHKSSTRRSLMQTEPVFLAPLSNWRICKVAKQLLIKL